MPAPLTDRLLRALGADPPVFRAVARAQALMIRRRGYSIYGKKARPRSRLSGFHTLCAAAGVNGLVLAAAMVAYQSPIVGAAFALTGGCGFLLLVIITDYFEALVDPREYAVIAAHPHDDWSVVLAKLTAVGRSLAILAAIMLVPPAIAAGFVFHAPVAAPAFLIGAAGATLAAIAGGMLLGAGALAGLGAALFNRFVTVVQLGLLVMVMVTAGGVPILRHLTATRLGELGIGAWFLPSLWFLAPLELVTAAREPATAVRLLLATGTLVGCAAVGARWIAARIGAELLEPPARGAAAPQRARAAAAPTFTREQARFSPARLLFRTTESRALARLAGAHFRADTAFRIQMFVMPVIFLIMSSRTLLRAHSAHGPNSYATVILLLSFFAGMLVVVQGAPFSRSSQPGNLWCVLVSPLRRGRFAMAVASVLRLWFLLPAAALILGYELLAARMAPLPAATGIAKIWAMGELMLRLGRGLLPEMPFSKPMRAAGERAGAQIGFALAAAAVSGGCTLVLAAAGRFGWAGDLAGAAVFALLAIPAGWWAKRRVAEASERFELAAVEV